MTRRLFLPAMGLVVLTSALCGPAPAGALLGQAPGERSVQKTLPQSSAPLWSTLHHARVGEDRKRGLFTVAFTQDIKALAGSQVTLSGFVLPLDDTPISHHFLLSRYTPVCFFCPPGAPNEVVEVVSKRGLKLSDRLVTISGRLTLNTDNDKGLFFRIDPAS